jgi:hypothetical protein
MKLHEVVDLPKKRAAEAALLKAWTEAGEERDPLILKILTGLSAWVASLFLLGFVIAGLGVEETAILILGVMLAGLAIAAHNLNRNAGIFMQQSTLSCMMCAHIMILGGVVAHYDHSQTLLTLAITQTLLCVIPSFAYRRGVYQAATLLLTAALWTSYAVEINAPWLFRLILAIQVIALGVQVVWRTRRDSLTYALALAIGVTILFLDWVHSVGYHGVFDEALWPTNLIIAALMAAVGTQFVAPEHRTQPKVLVLFALLILLAFLSSPGLLYAVALLVLGYGLRDRIFGGLGLIGLPLFLIYFYYSLDVSLLHKSGILFASGIIGLLTAYLAKRVADKEVVSQ